MREELRKLDELFTVEGLKNNWNILAVVSVFCLALWLRYMPEQGMAYLQALDPYMIFRTSQHLALEGNLPSLDFMRYFPYATPTYLLNMGDIVFPSILYWMGPFLFFENYMEWAQFYPALMGSLSVVFAYFLGKEIWDKVAGVSAAFMLATIPGVMHRTSAGFFEKEPIGTFFMMASLYLFVRAWNRDEWWPGIGSGLMFAFFTISWGGSKMLWLLYPLVTGSLIFINQDVKKLLKAYTPTIILGGLIGSALNPARFWVTDSLFLANLGLVALIWSRYVVEELELIEKKQLKYYVPGVSVLGLLGVLASPLIYPPIYSKFLQLVNMATQSGSGVIAGTVAENQAASFGQLVTQLSSLSSANVIGVAGFLANIVGAFPLSFMAISLMATALGFMTLRKFDIVEKEVESSTYYIGMAGTFLAWTVGFAAYFNVVVGASANLTLVIAPIFVTFLTAVGFKASSVTEKVEIRFNWLYVLPLFWVLSNMLMSIAKSRLIFLAAFPVAFTSGYTISVFVKEFQELEVSEYFESREDAERIVLGLISAAVLIIAAVNVSAGYASVQRLGGSPNHAWDQSLDYMENQTDEGAVILSWWDYGYWFESIGRRAAVADGGNLNYYNNGQRYGKINYPLADLLASNSPENHTGFLEKHSVDYVVLDSTMIGKYSAVSQIHNRDNDDFNSMITLSTSGSFRQSLSQSGNQTMVEYSGGGRTQGLSLYTPIEEGDGSLDLGSPSTLRTPRGSVVVECSLTDEGVEGFNGSSPYCVAEDPYLSLERASQNHGRTKAILVPKEIARSTLVRLYLMNGAGVEWAEPVPEASNGYVRMWEVDTS